MAHSNTSQIVVLGAMNSDFLIKGKKFPRPGETLEGETFFAAAGGKGANQAVGAARLGATVALISCVGADARGKEMIAGLKTEGVDTRFVFTAAKEQTGAALCLVNTDGEKMILAAPGANRTLNIAHIEQAAAAISSAKVFLTQFEAPLETVLAAARIAYRASVKVVLDPAPALPDLPKELFRLLHAVRPNSHEAEVLSGIKVTDRVSAAKSARVLQERGVHIVAIQASDEGNLLRWGDEEIWLPKIKVKAMDATGAGDAFAAALAVAIAEGRPPKWAGHFASAAAALKTTKLGAQPAMPHRKDVESLMQQTLKLNFE
jgi:ribokinase